MTSEKSNLKTIQTLEAKLTRLQTQVLTLQRQKQNLKDRLQKQQSINVNSKLKFKAQKQKLQLNIADWEAKYNQLKNKMVVEGQLQVSSVRKLYSVYPNLGEAFTHLCKDWNLKTLNMRNTAQAMLKLIEPDANGVVEYTEQDIVNYITLLIKLGRNRYMQNSTLAEFYEPYDSIVLFKHYKQIRKNLLQWLDPKRAQSERLGFKMGFVELDGKVLEPKKRTAVCSWTDLRNQKIGKAHVNDSVDIGEFRGDDLIRERERRRVKKTGIYDEQAVISRLKYQAKRYCSMEQIIQATPIKEEESK